jgi:uncharacterized protein
MNVTICKLDHTGNETWRYTGTILARSATSITVQAYFNLPDTVGEFLTFRRGDRYLEWFYTDRWYNVFEIHDVDDDALKGWYCNVTRPATWDEDSISWSDLALDVWIDPRGNVFLLDEDEFEALPIDMETRIQALRAIEDLRGRVNAREIPFDGILP